MPAGCSAPAMDLKATAGGDRGRRHAGRGCPDLARGADRSRPSRCVARVGGPARAGGIGLIAACDVALAGRSATFAFSEVRIGVVPAVISVPVLPLLAPRAARELFLTGEVFDATRAADGRPGQPRGRRRRPRRRGGPLRRHARPWGARRARRDQRPPRTPVHGLRGPVRPLRRSLRQPRGSRRRRRLRREAPPLLGIHPHADSSTSSPVAGTSRIVSGRPLTIERLAPSRSTSSAVRYTACCRARSMSAPAQTTTFSPGGSQDRSPSASASASQFRPTQPGNSSARANSSSSSALLAAGPSTTAAAPRRVASAATAAAGRRTVRTPGLGALTDPRCGRTTRSGWRCSSASRPGRRRSGAHRGPAIPASAR